MKLITADKLIKIKGPDFEGALKVYGALYYDALGRIPDLGQLPRVRRVFNLILGRGYTITQLYVLLFCHFEWYGETGNDERCLHHLKANGFPIDWLPKNAHGYTSYIIGVLGDEVWGNEIKLRTVLDYWLKKLFAEKIG